MRPPLRENLAGLRPIRGLLLSVAVARSSVMLFPFYAAYLGVTRDDLGQAGVGLVVGAFGVGALVADVVSGALSRWVPERAVAVAGMVGVALVVGCIPLTSGLWPLTVETAAWGFCHESVNPVAYAMVARAVPESARRFAFAAVRLAVNLGMGVGPVLAGALFAVDPGLLVWGTVSGYLVAAGILVRARVGTDHVAEAGTKGPEPAGRSRHEQRFWSFFVAVLPIHLAYALPPTVVSAYVVQELGHPPLWVSAVFAVNTIMVITCEIGLNHLMGRWRRKTALLCGHVCALAGFGLMGLGANPWLLVLATVVWTLGEMVLFPVMLDHVSAISPGALRARNLGLYSAGVNVGVLAGPVVFLPLSAVLDAPAAWGVVAAVVAVGMTAIAGLSAAKGMWTGDEPAVAGNG